MGAGPLLEKQTTIVWPVVGSKSDGALRIPVRRARNGRAALGLPAKPSGAVATAPGTSGPPGQVAAKAHDFEGAPRRISTSAGSGSPYPRGVGPWRRRRDTQSKSRTRRYHGRRGRTTRGKRAGDAVGSRGPQSPSHHCGRGSGRNPGIRCGRRRLTFRRRRPFGASAIPYEYATHALYLQGSDKRRDPPDLTGGVSGSHQGGRPGSALPVPVVGEGSMPERLIWLHRHAACLRSPVRFFAWGSVRQSLARPRFPRWGHVLL